jgi:hypothetical protein
MLARKTLDASVTRVTVTGDPGDGSIRSAYRSVTTIATVLTREDAVAWTARNYGPTHAERRVSDAGYAFWVTTESDAVLDGREPPVYGGMSILVLKRTGQYWFVGSNPDCLGVLNATSEREMRRAMKRAGLRRKRPDGTFEPGKAMIYDDSRQPAPEPTEGFGPAYAPASYDPTPFVDHERLAWWLRNTTGWRHIESRIVDIDWAFSVSTQPDEYHDGDRNAITYGNGPMIVVKRDGAVWRLSSQPAMVPAFGAATEDDFWRILRDAAPYFDPNDPPERIPR